jgi:hypothetical protein
MYDLAVPTMAYDKQIQQLTAQISAIEDNDDLVRPNSTQRKFSTNLTTRKILIDDLTGIDRFLFVCLNFSPSSTIFQLYDGGQFLLVEERTHIQVTIDNSKFKGP